MAQLIPVLEKDESILGISAWNPYGYVGVSGNPHAAYRVEDFPGLGVLFPMKVFKQFMKGKMKTCCYSASYVGWRNLMNNNKGKHLIIPDVSRVLMRPKDIYEQNRSDIEREIFTRPRVTNTDETAWIERPYDLVEDRYFQKVVNLIQSSITFYLTKDDLNLCKNGSNIALTTMLRELKNKIISVYFREKSCRTTELMKLHMKCFGIYFPENFRVQNIYKKVLRVTINTNTVFLIDSSSPFAKNKQLSLQQS